MGPLLPLPVAEGVEQAVAHGGGKTFGGQRAQRRDGHLHLAQIVTAAPARAQMLFEARGIPRREGMVQVGRDELDELLAAQVIRRHRHAVPYFSP